MKEKLFYFINYIAFFLIGYLILRFVYFGSLLNNSRFFDLYSFEEKIKNGIIFWLPINIFFVIEIAVLLLGKKLFVKWGWKEKIITILSSVFGVITSGVILVFLNP